MLISKIACELKLWYHDDISLTTFSTRAPQKRNLDCNEICTTEKNKNYLQNTPFAVSNILKFSSCVQTVVSASKTGSSLLITFKQCTILLDCGLELCTSNGVHYKLPAFNGVDLSAVDVLLVSNYFNITALPFLTEYMNFKGRIYATLPSVQFGKFV
jgi:hypothetical protein